MKQTLSREHRKILETTVAQARIHAEAGAEKTLKALAVAAKDDHQRRRLTAATPFPMFLNWRTWHSSIRAKDTAVALFWFEYRMTPLAFIEPLTGISRHCFGLDMTTLGASQD
jgi:hypothetical protein